MTTIVDNNQRHFIIQSQCLGNKRDIVCNLKSIPQLLKENFEPGESFKIVEYFNRKLKVLSKRKLNQMFAAHKINFKIK